MEKDLKQIIIDGVPVQDCCYFDYENYGIIDDDDVYEVIGNIYENPELLKEKS